MIYDFNASIGKSWNFPIGCSDNCIDTLKYTVVENYSIQSPFHFDNNSRIEFAAFLFLSAVNYLKQPRKGESQRGH
ncbi:MAG: hypothetical protein ACI8P3_004259 [Saprospiraceae bacterium]|jgi:hypothetical protein